MNKQLTKLHILLIAGMLSITACNNSGNNGTQNMADSAVAKVDTVMHDVKQGAEDAAAKVENAVISSNNPDSNFLVKACLDNNKELKLLQAGVDNGTSKELKAHAKMMIGDHKKLAAKVKDYAAKKNYILPDGDNGKSDDEMSKLNSKTKGADWDKEWTDALTSGHQDAINMFETEKDNAKDPDLKTLVADALPTLHAHLDMMKQLQDKMKK